MKTLCIVRHAKSSWNEEALTDEQRPLNARGRKAAPVMGRVLREHGFIPDLVMCSTAVRAHTTARLLAVELGIAEEHIIEDRRIYMADVRDILQLLPETADRAEAVMLVGHNPGLYMLAMHLGGFNEENLPTAAAVCIDFDVESWSDLEPLSGTIRFYEYPRRHEA